MSDDRQQDDALNRFWNDLTDASGDPAPSGLDSSHAETLRQLHALTRTPPPATARTRVDRAMRERLAVPLNGRGVATMGSGSILTCNSLRSASTREVPRQSAGRPAPGTARRGFRWATVQFATALLLLVTLGLGYVALKPGTSNNQRLTALPALEAPATSATDERATRTLATITLPAGMVPSPIVGGLNHYTIPAGTSSGTGATWVSKCCHGPRFEYIVSGSFTVRSAGPVQLLRDETSEWETLPAETEVSVTAGDALLLRLEDAFDAVNTTSVPVELVEVVLIDTTVPGDPIPAGWVYHDQDLHTTSLAVPDGPATLRLQQTTLAPDTDLPLPPDALFQFAVSLEQGAYLATGTDFVVQYAGPGPVVAYVLTLVPAGAGTAPPTASPEVPADEAVGTPSR